MLWGSLTPDKRLKYAVGAFSGLDNEAINPDSELQYAVRLAYNFWNVEDNPGYWTSSTYYGKASDIFTVGASNIYHKDGAGTAADRGDFIGIEGDVLLEKVLANNGVVTFLGEGKSYELTDLNETAVRLDPNCFCLFGGYSYSTGLLYLFPQQVGIGQIQPYARVSQIFPAGSMGCCSIRSNTKERNPPKTSSIPAPHRTSKPYPPSII